MGTGSVLKMRDPSQNHKKGRRDINNSERRILIDRLLRQE